MSDNKHQTVTPIRAHVNVDDAAEILHWCNELRCTEGQLRDAVSRVGTTAMRVRAFFGREF